MNSKQIKQNNTKQMSSEQHRYTKIKPNKVQNQIRTSKHANKQDIQQAQEIKSENESNQINP